MFCEIRLINSGSPFNPVGGQQARSLQFLAAHIERQNMEKQERAFQRLEKEMETERGIKE